MEASGGLVLTPKASSSPGGRSHIRAYFNCLWGLDGGGWEQKTRWLLPIPWLKTKARLGGMDSRVGEKRGGETNMSGETKLAVLICTK